MGIRRRRGNSWLRTVAVSAGAILAVAGCGTAVGRSADPGRSLVATKAAGASTEATQSGGPVASAGPGWTLAEYSAAGVSEGKPGRAGATTLYLVSPQGTKTTLYRWGAAGEPGWRLVDWSGDKARALFVGSTPNSVGQLVLATGKFTSFKLPGGTQAISYSRPDGTAILAAQQASGGDKILRYGLTGKLEKTLASGPRNAANVALYSADGTSLAVNGAQGLEQVSNSGGAAKSLPVPGAGTCQPVRWWNISTILASCLASGRNASRLWLVPVTGGKPTALTAQRDGKGPDLGDVDAWKLPSGLYLQALGPCGAIFIAKQASDGSATAVNVPQTKGNDNQVVTADGGRLLVRAQTSCVSSTSLLWFTPATNAVQMLIHAPSGTQGVIAAVACRPAGT